MEREVNFKAYWLKCFYKDAEQKHEEKESSNIGDVVVHAAVYATYQLVQPVTASKGDSFLPLPPVSNSNSDSNSDSNSNSNSNSNNIYSYNYTNSYSNNTGSLEMQHKESIERW